MAEEDLLQLSGSGQEIVNDLMKIIPSWREVDLTKIGYNAQYVQTILSVAMYVVEREKKVLKDLQP
jgi:hypothetical protein